MTKNTFCGRQRICRYLVVLLLAVSGISETNADDRVIALVGGMLIDGYDASPIHHSAVIIQGGEIIFAGEKG